MKPTAEDVSAAEQAMESLFGGASGTASEVLSAGNNELSNALGSISAVDPNASLVGLSNNEAVRRQFGCRPQTDRHTWAFERSQLWS